MVNLWQVLFTRQALKDLDKLKEAGLSQKAKDLTELLAEDPFRVPPPYEKLIGDLAGKYSRRINRQHRLVYIVSTERKTVKILSMWTHYENL